MAARYELEAFGFATAARHFRQMGERAQDYRPVFRKLFRWIQQDEAERFAGGAHWRPLDPDTIRRKASEGKDPRILRAHGVLADALTHWKAPGGKRKLGRQDAFWGVDPAGVAFYARFHQQGDGLPKREVIDLTQRTKLRFYQAVRDHLLGR